jgi:hypothetical protein
MMGFLISEMRGSSDTSFQPKFIWYCAICELRDYVILYNHYNNTVQPVQQYPSALPSTTCEPFSSTPPAHFFSLNLSGIVQYANFGIMQSCTTSTTIPIKQRTIPFTMMMGSLISEMRGSSDTFFFSLKLSGIVQYANFGIMQYANIGIMQYANRDYAICELRDYVILYNHYNNTVQPVQQ